MLLFLHKISNNGTYLISLCRCYSTIVAMGICEHYNASSVIAANDWSANIITSASHIMSVMTDYDNHGE